jgi:hypothetical protein
MEPMNNFNKIFDEFDSIESGRENEVKEMLIK